MTLGDIQEEDVLLIQAVIRMTCPIKLVELGYLNGYSAKKILEAMRDDATLVSYDNTIIKSDITDKRFTFKNKNQIDCDENAIDFIFFDASHNLELNKQTWIKILPNLQNYAIIAIHDTGLWNEMIQDTGGKWIGKGYAHRPDEREFVNWIKTNYKMDAINFHTLKETRHGMTLLQHFKEL